jgi:hypothetical protein
MFGTPNSGGLTASLNVGIPVLKKKNKPVFSVRPKTPREVCLSYNRAV